jgi:hypothetical protein
MQTLKLKMFEKQINLSQVWGGGTDGNCYCMSTNSGLSETGACDTVFTIDSKGSAAPSKVTK